MKKKLIVYFIILVLLSSFVLSQERNSTETEQEKSASDNDLEETTTEGRERVKESISKIAEKTDPIVEYRVIVPEFMQKLLDIFLAFGRGDGSPTLSKLLISIMLWILFFMAFHNAISLFSSFSNRSNLTIAALLAFTIGTLGWISFLADLLINIGNGISVLKDWSTGQLITSLLILAIILFFLNMFSKYRKRHDTLIRARMRGIFVGADIAAAGAIVESHAKITKKLTESKGDKSETPVLPDWKLGRQAE